SLAKYESEVKHLQAGYAVEVAGELVDSPGKEQRFEIRARRVVVVGGVGPDYPLQKKRHSFEFLRTIAHLRTRTNTFGAVMRVRSAAARAIRHLAEFWMVEPEMAFCDLAGDTELAEAFLKHLFRTVLDDCPEDMKFFNDRIDSTAIATLEHIISSPFERLTYDQTIEILTKHG